MSGKENTIVTKAALLADDDLTSEAQTSTGGTQVTGLAVDLQAVANRRYRRVRVAIPYRVANATTVEFRVNLSATPQHSTAEGSGYAAFGTAPTAVDVGATGNVDGVFEFEQDLTLAERYYRTLFTPEFRSATGGVTTATGVVFSYAGAAILTDPNRYPASG